MAAENRVQESESGNGEVRKEAVLSAGLIREQSVMVMEGEGRTGTRPWFLEDTQLR